MVRLVAKMNMSHTLVEILTPAPSYSFLPIQTLEGHNHDSSKETLLDFPASGSDLSPGCCGLNGTSDISST